MDHSELWTQWSFALNKALIAIHPISKQGAKWMILGFFCLRSFSKSKNIICDFLSYQNCDFMSCDFLSIYHFLSGRDRMVVGFTTNYLCNQCLAPLMMSVRISIRTRCTTLHVCDKVCQWLATGRWFSPGPPVSSTNESDRHDTCITEILLKVALNTIK